MIEKEEEKFAKFFTADAWKLISSYFIQLEAKLVEYDIPRITQTSTIQGLIEYLEEFVENYKLTDKINFSGALSLLEEIGSPSDILLTLDISEPPSRETDERVIPRGKVCSHCLFNNVQSADFCENCGISFKKEEMSISKIKQMIIDHPYSVSFVVAYSILVCIFSIYPLIPSNNILQSISSALFYAFLPAPLLAVLNGWILDYFFKDKKSQKYKYTKLLDDLESNFAIGSLALFLSACIILLLALMLQFSILAMIAIIIWVAIFFSLIIDTSLRPDNIPYIQLLKLKNSLEDYTNKKLQNWNLYLTVAIIPFTILLIVIMFTLPPGVGVDIFGVMITGLLFIVAIYAGFNGILVMYYYSWPIIKRYLQLYLE